MKYGNNTKLLKKNIKHFGGGLEWYFGEK